MAVYPETMTLEAARARFFARARLGPDGGYAARWVRVETKPIAVYFPNTRCRVEAAKLHDLHHVANEYGTDWPGEAELAAWEIAGGCGRYGWAWVLDLGAFTVGLVIAPRRLWRAFVRGRRAANLYHGGLAEVRLSKVTVGVLRARLGLTAASAPRPATAAERRGDVVAFVGWSLLGVLGHVTAAAVGLAVAYRIARAAGLA